MKAIICIIIIMIWVIITGLTFNKLFNENTIKNVKFGEFMMCFFPILHLYTFAKYVILQKPYDKL